MAHKSSLRSNKKIEKKRQKEEIIEAKLNSYQKHLITSEILMHDSSENLKVNLLEFKHEVARIVVTNKINHYGLKVNMFA